MFLINGYYMDAPDTFDAKGGKLGFSMDGIEATLKYASTNEDVQGTKDGNIMAVDLGYSNDLFGINGGYIKTDKDGGIGSLDALGDNINPLDSGNQVYSPDAKTYYIGANTTLAGFDLGAIYGSTKYDNGGTQEKEKEFNFTVDKEIFSNTTLSLLYADIDAHNSTDDSRYYFAQVVYSF